MKNTRNAVLLGLFVLSLAFVLPVQAQDQKGGEQSASKPAKVVSKDDKKKALKLLSEAYKVCNNDAKAAEKHTLAALEVYPDYLRARLFLGWLYNIKLGELDKSIQQYDYVIRHTPKKTVNHRKLKAEAFCEKGNVVYASKRDAKAALENYNSAFSVFPTWQYAEVASNLYLHVGDVEKAHERASKAKVLLERLQAKIAKQLQTARGRKKTMIEQRKAQIPEQMQKVNVQIATCLAMSGKGEEAKALLKDVKEFSINVKYNLAILRCVQKDNEAAMTCLKEFMKTRSTPEARDQLRDFITEEPGLAGLKSHKGYAELVKREVAAQK